MKYAKYIIGWFIAGLVLSYGLSVAATTLQGFQGGTGYATTSASNMGNFLQVASTSPYLTYTFGTSTGGTGTLSGNGTPTQVAFYTALQTLSSSLNLFWDNINSRLGIGTSTPQFPLHVMGDIKSTGSSTAEHFILGGFAPDSIYPATDPNSSISWTGPDVMQLTTGGTARITINAAGNVGVGTTTPATALVVNGDITQTTLSTGLVKSTSGKLINATSGTDYTLMTAFSCPAGQHVASSTSAGVFTCSADTGSAGGVTTSTPFSAGYVPMATSGTAITNSNIYQSGSNVGVGTTTPAALLEVNGTLQVDATSTLKGNLVVNTGASTSTLSVGQAGTPAEVQLQDLTGSGATCMWSVGGVIYSTNSACQ